MKMFIFPQVFALAAYTHAIDSLKNVLITLGTSIGAVMLVYGGIKFAMAFRQMDQQGEHQAVYFWDSAHWWRFWPKGRREKWKR